MSSMDVGALRVRGGRLSALLPGLLRTLLLALACNLALELVRMTAVEGVPWRYKSGTFLALFLLGSLVVWVLVGLVHAVTGRLRYTVAVMALLTLLVALADWKKVQLRGEPLYPIDWSLADELGSWREIAGPVTTFLVVAVPSVVALALGVGLAWWARRRGRRPARMATDPSTARRRLALRLGTGAACLLLLGQVTQFNEPGNQVRAGFETAGAVWRPWSQQRNYLGNGFVAGVLYNTDVPPMAAPPGYGPATMSEIVRRYAAHARRINEDRETGSLDGVNVVMVLSESLSDPSLLRGVTVAQDPLPFTRRLMRSTTSGQLLVPGIGGGTANAEFEVLTGMSLGLFPPQLRVPFQMLVPEREHFPSLVQWYERAGHRPVAVHPFSTEMYRRRDVYRAFGFDEFVHQETLAAPRRLGHDGYVSDASAFDEVVARLRGSERALFVQLVTMQNHIPYEGRYDHPIPVRGPDGGPLPPTGHYLRGLWHSDRALQDLVRDLRRLPEPSVLVVYGDHLPGTYPREVRLVNGWSVMHRTPFVVWSTFAATPVRPPLVSPTHLTDLVLEHVDAPVTPYTALLTRLRAQVPALVGRFSYDADGRRVPLPDLPPDAQQVLHDYRMVQYDLAVGKGWSEAGMLSDLRPLTTR